MADVEEETEDEEVQPVGGRKRSYGNSHSGWCLSKTDTDEHSRCPVTVGSFTCSCTCEGHGSRAGEQPAWIGRELDLILDSSGDYGTLEATNQP